MTCCDVAVNKMCKAECKDTNQSNTNTIDLQWFGDSITYIHSPITIRYFHYILRIQQVIFRAHHQTLQSVLQDYGELFFCQITMNKVVLQDHNQTCCFARSQRTKLFYNLTAKLVILWITINHCSTFQLSKTSYKFQR